MGTKMEKRTRLMQYLQNTADAKRLEEEIDSANCEAYHWGKVALILDDIHHEEAAQEAYIKAREFRKKLAEKKIAYHNLEKEIAQFELDIEVED